MADIWGIVGKVVDAVSNYGTAKAANEWAKERERIARDENYIYGESAADAADMRTRRLYTDLYSPNAQLEQLKAAGLSPSLFYGDGGGIAGQSGAMGSGASGILGQTFGMQPTDFGQLGLQQAQTELLKAQTKKTESETQMQDLENDVKKLENTAFKEQYTIVNAHISKSDGTQQSLAEIADECYTYEQFLKTVREAAEQGQDLVLRDATTSENGQQVLRELYTAQSKLGRDIAVLSSQEVDANFQKQIAKELLSFSDENGNTIAKLTAQDAVSRLRKNIQQNNLDERQKEAWNNLLNKLGHGTLQDVAIVLLLTLNNALSNYGNVNAGFYKSLSQSHNVNENVK